MFYLYILHSASANKYYVGHSDNYSASLEFHNTNENHKYTGKNNDWKLISVFETGSSKEDALELEKFINRQKNIKLLMKLIDPSFIPADKLASLKRVTL